jgi:hypothetical protein
VRFGTLVQTGTTVLFLNCVSSVLRWHVYLTFTPSRCCKEHERFETLPVTMSSVKVQKTRSWLLGHWRGIGAIYGPFHKKATCICHLSNTPLSQPFILISCSVLFSCATRECLAAADALCLDTMQIIHKSRGWDSWRWQEGWTDSHLVTLAKVHRVQNRFKRRKKCLA